MNIYKQLAAKAKQCLYQSPQGILVYQHRQYRWVLFNDLYIQTMIDVKKPHRPVLPYLQPMLSLLSVQPGHVCLLGLGGGGAIHALNQQHPKITVVEKFPDMIEIAKHFFFIKERPGLSIVCDCAANFLSQTSEQFDTIIIDLGDEYGFPSICNSLEFFSNAYSRLNEQGILILNLPHHGQINDFGGLLQQVFNHRALPIYAQGNWLLIAIKGSSGRHQFIEKLKQKHLIQRFSWDAEFGEQVYLRSPLTCFLHEYRSKVLNIFKKDI